MKQLHKALLMPWAGGGNPLAYTNAVLALSPFVYWPMAEASGSTAINAEGTAARNGTYPAPTATPTLGATGIGDGRTCPSFDGGDYVVIQTASFNAAFSGAEGTIAGWFRVSAAGDWTDGVERCHVRVFADGNNTIHLRKNSGNNTFTFVYASGGVGKVVSNAAISTTAWVHAAVTWSAAADQMKAYLSGAQIGVTQTGLGVWAGAPSPSGTFIGANSTVANFWKGTLAHVAVWSTPLSAAQILTLATVV